MPLKDPGKYQVYMRAYMRDWMRRHRADPLVRQQERLQRRGKHYHAKGICQVCGFKETIDVHHEGALREIYLLCPNCHALVTRGLKTLDELLSNNQGEQGLNTLSKSFASRQNRGKMGFERPWIGRVDADGNPLPDD